MANHTRYVRIAKEATYGTAIAHDHASFVVGEVESESFQQSYDVMKRSDMNYYGAAKAIVSKKTAEGSISMALQPCRFTLLISQVKLLSLSVFLQALANTQCLQ